MTLLSLKSAETVLIKLLRLMTLSALRENLSYTMPPYSDIFYQIIYRCNSQFD